MKRSAPEDLEQKLLAQWLRLEKIPFYHVPNGGYRNTREGAKFKALGVSPGVPDICIPIAKYPYHGLYIELKRKSGYSVTQNQKNWIEVLSSQGYLADVCCGFEKAKDLVLKYMNYKDWPSD